MREINISGIGNVKFLKTKRSKSIGISVKPISGVQVSMPKYISYSEAERVVAHKKEWILFNLNKVGEIEKNYTKFSHEKFYQTKHHKLILHKKDQNSISVRVQNGNINVSYPYYLKTESEIVQGAIRKGIERALKIEAKTYLPIRVKVLAEKHGFFYNNVFVKNVKTRWGSCSRRKNINLNIHLMRLPENLIDYVILHELAHTIELNHSKKFWNLLENIVYEAKQLDKMLKNYRVSIY